MLRSQIGIESSAQLALTKTVCLKSLRTPWICPRPHAPLLGFAMFVEDRDRTPATHSADWLEFQPRATRERGRRAEPPRILQSRQVSARRHTVSPRRCDTTGVSRDALLLTSTPPCNNGDAVTGGPGRTFVPPQADRSKLSSSEEVTLVNPPATAASYSKHRAQLPRQLYLMYLTARLLCHDCPRTLT